MSKVPTFTDTWGSLTSDDEDYLLSSGMYSHYSLHVLLTIIGSLGVPVLSFPMPVPFSQHLVRINVWIYSGRFTTFVNPVLL
jgi:hypothetical protein